jgi:hypothetical protein
MLLPFAWIPTAFLETRGQSRMDKPKYLVLGIRPDGSVGVCRDCETFDTAHFMAAMIRRKYPDWKVRIDTTDDTEIEMPVME